ncbi:MAG: YqaJ viral recombinase family protein [Methylomonas sp.]|jgi:hypothetical protein|uniref:YqaJ viral recombinase family protein n=1 Tax=Methylomonas sp. TaxID=418 RepID=UPI0025CD7672|nr:YqaJ viral recombinase family protein [Methylomonas sp.]MCK9607538.1 YqaJ viral recombinase family protein [Methylomonas sp.]
MDAQQSLICHADAPQSPRFAVEPPASFAPSEDARLAKIKETASALPKQNTEAWYKLTKTTIGGSELPAILFTPGCYSSMEDIIAAKMGLRENTGNIATQWGKLFEPILRNYLSKKYDCQIECSDICIIHREEGTRLSPDGIFRNKAGDLVYFEQKNPFKRIPDGKIPAIYMPQLAMGFRHIPDAKEALFADSVFRRCTIGQLQNVQANPLAFVPIFGQAIAENTHLIASGAEFFIGDVARDADTPLVDLGCAYTDVICDICNKFVAGELRMQHVECIADIPPNAVAVLPWKLFTLFEVRVTREECAGIITPAVLDRIHRINVACEAAQKKTTDEERWEIFHALMTTILPPSRAMGKSPPRRAPRRVQRSLASEGGAQPIAAEETPIQEEILCDDMHF